MRISFNAPVVLTYSMLCTLGYAMLNLVGVGNEIFVLDGEAHPASITWWISLVGYGLGHANVDHLLGNLSFVLLLGPMLEHKYGGKKLVAMIAFTSVVTAVCHVLLFKDGLLGASGIVFMMILLAAQTPRRGSGIPLTLILVIVLFIGKELLHAFKDDQVSQFAHLAGGICGLVLGRIFAQPGKGKEIAVPSHSSQMMGD